MKTITPFICFNTEAGEAAELYLRVFPRARKLGEVRSTGVGPWPEGAVATVTLELEGQEMVFLNAGPRFQMTPAFSFFVSCETQDEINRYWDQLVEGGKAMACGWLTDRFGLCWQIAPRQLGEWIRQPKAMSAMMEMQKLEMAVLEAAARER